MNELLESFRKRHKRDSEVQECCAQISADLGRGLINDAHAKWFELIFSRHEWGTKSWAIAGDILKEFELLGAKPIHESKAIELQDQMLERMRRMDKESRRKRKEGLKKEATVYRMIIIVVLLALIPFFVYIIFELLTTTDMIVIPCIFIGLVPFCIYGVWRVWKATPSEIFELLNHL